MNAIIRWGLACLVAVAMTAGLCAASFSQVEASMIKKPVPYSQEEKKPDADKKENPGEEDEGCKC